MAEKRRPSTRLRTEPLWRKKAFSEQEDAPISPVQQIYNAPLPRRLLAGQLLPTISSPENAMVPDDTQSLVESGVALQAFQQSKESWLSNGIFERYWTKPSKKRPDIDASNPPLESMEKLGLCTLIIEPHSFECTVFAVKEAVQSSEGSPRSATEMVAPAEFSKPRLAPHTGPRIKEDTSPISKRRSQSSSHHSNPNLAAGSPRAEAHIAQSRRIPGGGTIRDTTEQSQEQTPKPSTDPVIQLLASRAATDNTLRELMKVVASGSASNAELRVFSAHIEDLNALLRESHNQKEIRSSMQVRSSKADQTDSNRESKINSGAAGVKKPQSQTDLKPKSSRTYRGNITAVALQFSAGTSDRFLFPKQSILEYQAEGTQVVASFLAVKKGDQAYGKSYEAGFDYHQPITMCLRTHQARILEPLSSVVSSRDDVRSYMNEIMHNTRRADFVHLALRLPKNTREEGPDNEVHLIDLEASQTPSITRFTKRKKERKFTE
ncbi:MAG: hypothetical protein M1814_000143 [Vezdaea aestivalis]|nr:MAG: hypothetical protein M1814_000143 [Vezdaea aestivalis]